MTTRLQLHRRLPAARAAVAVGFMVSGIAFASWVVRIPDAQERLGLSEGRLGLVLLRELVVRARNQEAVDRAKAAIEAMLAD